MWRPLAAVVTLSLFTLFGLPTQSQQDTSKTVREPPELTPRRPECAILLPERGERRDIARLVRAEQFLGCERDGYPRTLAPPWKTSAEATKKLGDACEYFGAKAAEEYPEVGPTNLKLAADRCRVNVMQVILMQLIPGAGQPPR